MLVPVKINKAAKYAFDMEALKLLEEVRSFLFQCFGCSRKVYNLYVDFLYKYLELNGYQIGENIPDLKVLKLPEISEYKKTYQYLKDVDSLALSNAKQDFEDAVKRFNKEYDHKTYTKRAVRRDASGKEPLSFRGLKGMPKFHSKAQGHFSYTTNCQYPGDSNNLKNPTISLKGNMLHVPKIKNDIKLIVHYPLPDDAVIKNVTISMDTDGTFYASIIYEHTVMMEMSLRNAALSNDTSIIDKLKFLGLDYSQGDFYVDSDGRKANCPHAYKESEEKLAKLQRQLSKMVYGSRNYNKMLTRIKKLHKKIANQRKDFICKEAYKLSSNYDVIVVEDIDLRNMAQALSLGKNLHDNGFGMFREQLEKKLKEKGSILVRVDQWFPSSKRCSDCGYIYKDLKLGESEWVCPICGAVHKRDDNAASNIRGEGMRIFLEYFREYITEEEEARKRAEARSQGRKQKKKKDAA